MHLIISNANNVFAKRVKTINIGKNKKTLDTKFTKKLLSYSTI